MNKNVQKRKAHKNFFKIFSLYGLNNQRILRYAHGASPVHTLRESQGLSDLQIHSVELQVSVSGSAMCSLKVILSYPGDIVRLYFLPCHENLLPQAALYLPVSQIQITQERILSSQGIVEPQNGSRLDPSIITWTIACQIPH